MAEWTLDQDELSRLADFCRSAASRYGEFAEELRSGDDPVRTELAQQFDAQKAEAEAYASRLSDALSATVECEPDDIQSPGI